MAMTEKSRSALYTGLSSVVDEEAVQEMLSYFPARDVEEQVSKEFLRAELAEMASGLRSEFRAEIRAEIGALRTELREEIRRMVWMNLGGFVAFGAVIIAAVRI